MNSSEPTAAPADTAPQTTAAVQPTTTPLSQTSAPVSHGTSEDTKTLVTVLLLIFAFPIGAIVMLFWPKWKWWVKLLVLLPGIVISFFVAVFMLGALVAVNPNAAIKRAECMTQCSENNDSATCVKMCSDVNPDGLDATTDDSTMIEDSEIPEETMAPVMQDDSNVLSPPTIPAE